jgi:hypothetical protein
LIATANLKNGVQLWDSRFPKRLYIYTFCTVKLHTDEQIFLEKFPWHLYLTCTTGKKIENP